MPGFIVHAERKGLNGSFRYGHAFFLRTCLMSYASGWTLRTGSKDKETPGVQERRLSGKDIRFLYMAWVMGARCIASLKLIPFQDPCVIREVAGHGDVRVT